MTSTLAVHYERKRKALGSEFQGFYDDSLKTLFFLKSGESFPLKASKLMRHHRRELVNSVSRWTGHRKYDIRQLVNNLINRCDALNLHAKPDQADNIIGLTVIKECISTG